MVHLLVLEWMDGIFHHHNVKRTHLWPSDCHAKLIWKCQLSVEPTHNDISDMSPTCVGQTQKSELKQTLVYALCYACGEEPEHSLKNKK